ncbi:telomerase reverse transcriptase-like isoform X2 [Chelonus insularis]|uniref:telomerase reverse transcriptase-like isoform X2 n=1 Tax=Chelonus insularis TaxID=460826 RepID=UPI00158A1C60|nr:telomerase reverse transcriptase-like isoform X2 [Chelonus insularis]
MEGSTIPEWSEIRNIFGNTVAEYLKEQNCVVRKSKTGAFIMREKDRYLFDDCAHLIRNCKRLKKTDPQNQQACSTNPLPEILYVDTNIRDNLYLFENFRRNPDFEAINESFNPASPNSSPSRENVETSDDVDLDCLDGSIYLKHNKINQLRSEIFRHLYKIVKNKDKECALMFKAIVESFIRKHRAFKYNVLLDSFRQDETLIDGLLTKKQVIEFFHKIFTSVVPISLFGDQTNFKKIYHAVFFFLKAAERETFSIKYVFKRLNRNNVVWLRTIKDKREKGLILYHIVQWFFEEFVSGIITAYLYTEKGSDRQKYFFRRWKKKCDNKIYINKQVQKNIFLPVKVVNVDNIDVPVAKLVFYTKKDGIRPILSTRANPEQRNERQVIKSLLRQIYLKNHDIINLKKIHQVWSDFKKSSTSSANTPVYFVSCDILDAYGSIIQGDIFIFCLSVDPNTSPVTEEYIDSVAPEILPVTLPPGSLCCLDRNVDQLCKVINVNTIKQRLEAYIFKQHIYVSQKYYILKQGVGQGLPMSALLCDLYYENMLEKELSKFKEDGYFFRYVDDFLYLTKSEDAAKRFLKKVNEGIKSYNCAFKQQKTQTNLMPHNNEEFIYLGYRFNIKTFNVIPEYSSVPARYNTAISRPPDDTLSVFIQRISNFEGLKLCPLIMDLSINSKEVILNNIKKASVLNAQRCLALVINMFDIEDIDYPEIFRIIRTRCVQVLISEFLRMMSFNTEINENLKNQVKELVWSSYYEVFKAKKFIKKWFLRKIKQQYINSDFLMKG